ncbi:AI-2E family transporter [Sphingorhabdus arenilitoris]|uniref:AI-2E family transporter n=1 Tax=Sphingorhabdus arenilitoris TaxID=1490041 RepID=A0ABV8RIM4_9SPHN
MTIEKNPAPQFEDRVFLGFVIAASLAMLWISWPFLGAILWAVITAIMFAPVHDRLMKRMPRRRNLTAMISLLLVIAIIIVPFLVVGGVLIEEVIRTYSQLESRQIDFVAIFDQIRSAIPPSVAAYLDKYDVGDLQALQEKVSNIATTGVSMAAEKALNIGQSAFGLALSLGVMLYLIFFLLRDGRDLTRKIGRSIPLATDRKAQLFEKFTTVIRATVKGSIVVAIVQGFLGGTIFWALGIQSPLLWGVVMTILALVPAVGSALIWLPVAIYLAITGDYLSASILAGFGVLVIGSVDNFLRPILVGADTKMPDYVILITTLGGLSMMGVNGLIVGPVIAAMFIASWEIFTASRHGEANEELAGEGEEQAEQEAEGSAA